MNDSWSKVFKRAIEIEREGAKDFQDLLPSTGKRVRQQDETELSDQLTTNDETAVDEVEGGYCQPLKLAKFVGEAALCQKAGHSFKPNEGGTANASTETVDIKPEERNMVEVCGKQICRSWLKYHYLKLGGPCPESCLRKHEITCKPEHLYKDYSFKGLSAKQRKDILQQLKSE